MSDPVWTNDQVNDVRRKVHEQADEADRAVEALDRRCGGVLGGWVVPVHGVTRQLRAAADAVFEGLGESRVLRDEARQLRRGSDEVSAAERLVDPEELPTRRTWLEGDENYRISAGRQVDGFTEVATASLNLAIALEWTATMVDGATVAAGEYLLSVFDVLKEGAMALLAVEELPAALLALSQVFARWLDMLEAAEQEDFWYRGVTGAIDGYAAEQGRLAGAFPDVRWPQATAR
ncbi:hypothetical protein G5V58_03300 [Nocardioides anomalus]|uniref:Uncharacterized protein n=1 Tax=Nocardioides anomalus TaxID=2712223 RepID=A0A6G6W9M7_9ACTN|nr:hypothetical protein [Nocardioides anomalus]QIG41934.1 hypothetical protein G5V58_03300 [Nocardioides anomalus]